MKKLLVLTLSFLVVHGVFGADEVKSVSATEGDSVSLHTDVTEVQRDDQILWMFGPKETRIAEIYRKNLSTYHCNRTFGDRLQMSNRTGSLTIGNVRTEHSGLYKVQIVTNEATSCKTIKLTVYACLPLPVITSKSLNCSSSSSSLSSSPSSSSSKRSSVSNCSLLCSVVNVRAVTLSWYKGNSLLSSISVSDLSISLSLPLEVEYQENNIYSCVINNPITNQTTHLDITQLCHTCPESLRSYFTLLVVGVLLLAIVLGGILFWLNKNRKQTAQTDENEDIHYATAEFVAHPLHHTKPGGEDSIVYSSVAAPKE